jgi:hypothetical protein
MEVKTQTIQSSLKLVTPIKDFIWRAGDRDDEGELSSKNHKTWQFLVPR